MLSKSLNRLFRAKNNNKLNLDSSINYYNKLCDKYGNDIKAVGWISPKTQALRFLVLSLIDDLTGQSILDLGAGHGDLYKYLKDQKIEVEYEGIDLSSSMIKKARVKYPDVVFQEIDFLSPDFQKEYDYILASGALSVKVNDQLKYLKKTIKKMYALAKKGIAFNLLSSYAPNHIKGRRFYYYKPEEILKLCFDISPYVELKHNYLPNDFTVFMYKT